MVESSFTRPKTGERRLCHLMASAKQNTVGDGTRQCKDEIILGYNDVLTTFVVAHRAA